MQCILFYFLSTLFLSFTFFTLHIVYTQQCSLIVKYLSFCSFMYKYVCDTALLYYFVLYSSIFFECLMYMRVCFIIFIEYVLNLLLLVALFKAYIYVQFDIFD